MVIQLVTSTDILAVKDGLHKKVYDEKRNLFRPETRQLIETFRNFLSYIDSKICHDYIVQKVC